MMIIMMTTIVANLTIINVVKTNRHQKMATPLRRRPLNRLPAAVVNLRPPILPPLPPVVLLPHRRLIRILLRRPILHCIAAVTVIVQKNNNENLKNTTKNIKKDAQKEVRRPENYLDLLSSKGENLQLRLISRSTVIGIFLLQKRLINNRRNR